jgi:hypothetical protein
MLAELDEEIAENKAKAALPRKTKSAAAPAKRRKSAKRPVHA